MERILKQWIVLISERGQLCFSKSISSSLQLIPLFCLLFPLSISWRGFIFTKTTTPQEVHLSFVSLHPIVTGRWDNYGYVYSHSLIAIKPDYLNVRYPKRRKLDSSIRSLLSWLPHLQDQPFGSHAFFTSPSRFPVTFKNPTYIHEILHGRAGSRGLCIILKDAPEIDQHRKNRAIKIGIEYRISNTELKLFAKEKETRENDYPLEGLSCCRKTLSTYIKHLNFEE